MRRSRTLIAWAFCLAGVCGLMGSAIAEESQQDRISALEEKLDRSLKQIEMLTQRVQELEAQKAGVAVAAQPAPPASDTQQRLQNVEQQVAQMADSNAARGGGGGVPLHGFADVGIGNHTANEPELKGTNVGALDIFLNPQLGEHTRSLFELTFEVNEQGEFDADLERAQLGYQFSDAATVWIGRFHTPFGYYNTAFHHGQQIATSLRRPRFLLFEDQGGIMPNHTVGAWLTGADHLSDGKVTYDLFVGNGHSISDGEIVPHSGGVSGGSPTYGGNLGYVFGETLDGLKVGVSAFRVNITDDQEPGRTTRVDNVGVYFAYDTDRFEYLGEYYRFNDTDLSAGSGAYRSSAGFIQLAWRLSLATPYVRYERAILDQSDPYFALQSSGSSYYRAAMGLRFDLDLKSALKFELAHTKNTDRDLAEWNDVMLDYAIRF